MTRSRMPTRHDRRMPPAQHRRRVALPLLAVALVVALFALRFLVGAAEAPSFPANSRIVAAWFPASERGTASAIFNAAIVGSVGTSVRSAR